MFDITYTGSELLQEFIDARKAYKDAIYDFTFENRFLIYHFFVKDEARYVALDSYSGCGSEVTRRKKGFLYTKENYPQMLPRILHSIKYTGDWRYMNTLTFDPLTVIDAIFQTILPQYGYSVRREQIRLCKEMYLSLTEKQVGICEAEVGTGKTMAYLVASFIARENYAREYGFRHPVTITTSSIELQKMIVEKEIPQFSKMMQDYGLIRQPLSVVLRKGKEHYFCIARYNDFLDKISQHPEKYDDLIHTLKSSRLSSAALDLDKWDLPAAIRGKICVKGTCHRCKYGEMCRYAEFVQTANEKGSVDYQVTNHNLYLTAVRTAIEHPDRKILQNSPFVIVDEAHKLLEAAQSTFGEQISEDNVIRYINSVKHRCGSKKTEKDYRKLLQEASEYNREIFADLARLLPTEKFDDDGPKCITIPDWTITKILKLSQTLMQIDAMKKKGHNAYEIDGKQLAASLRVFIRQSDINIWLEAGENGYLVLCCCPNNMADILEMNVWDKCVSHVLTSGTMSDGKDFSFFKRENGIARLSKHLVHETSVLSPFDYEHHTRLYIPDDMPMPDNDDPEYVPKISKRIIDLISATNGHTAILFTSYKVLQQVYSIAEPSLRNYDLFCMTRNNRNVISDFKKSKNGILFASGSMWEGVDCVGDCLSSVIIVRLPFPLRSAVLEQKKEQTGSVGQFIRDYALPEMLIKLRQGAGRLVRNETDTGVISILDARASSGKYAPDVQSALEKYPRVNSIEEIEMFMHQVKADGYFDDKGETNTDD